MVPFVLGIALNGTIILVEVEALTTCDAAFRRRGGGRWIRRTPKSRLAPSPLSARTPQRGLPGLSS